MYKRTQDSRAYLSRVASHATKPAKSSRLGPTPQEEIVRIERMGLSEACDEKESLLAKKASLQELKRRCEIEGDEGAAQTFGVKMCLLDLSLSVLNRHIKNLRLWPEDQQNYRMLRQAVHDVCGDAMAERVFARRRDLQEIASGYTPTPVEEWREYKAAQTEDERRRLRQMWESQQREREMARTQRERENQSRKSENSESRILKSG